MEMSYSSLSKRYIDLDSPYELPEKEVPVSNNTELDSSCYPEHFSPENIGITWVYRGIQCCTAKSPYRNYNGYVKLPKDHPWYNVDYEDIPVQIHGGLTFADGDWIGFDTGHAYDIWEGDSIYNLPFPESPILLSNSIDWNMDMLVNEVENLAEQVVEAMHGNV